LQARDFEQIQKMHLSTKHKAKLVPSLAFLKKNFEKQELVWIRLKYLPLVIMLSKVVPKDTISFFVTKWGYFTVLRIKYLRRSLFKILSFDTTNDR